MTFTQLPGDAAASPATSPKIRYASDGCAQNIPLDAVGSQPALVCTRPSWASGCLWPAFRPPGMRTPKMHAGVSDVFVELFHMWGSKHRDLVPPTAKHGGFTEEQEQWFEVPRLHLLVLMQFNVFCGTTTICRKPQELMSRSMSVTWHSPTALVVNSAPDINRAEPVCLSPHKQL